LSEQRSYDAVIVGGGVIGLASAWRLAQAGATVAVLEREERLPAGATRVAAGMLAPVGELTFGEPALLELTLAAAELYPGFVAELEEASGVATGYEVRGALHVALDRDEAEQLRRVHDLQRSMGLAAEWLPPRACRDLEPGLTPSLSGGVIAPGEGSVDPRLLSAALLAALRREGAEVRTGTEVSEALLEGERIAGVRTAAGEELRAAAVVLSCGAWSGQAGWLPEDARPPVRPVKGQILELRSPGGAPFSPIERIVASERVYLVPRRDGRLIAGATVEERGFDTAVTAGGIHELLREAYRLLPDVAEMELVEATAGLRPGTPDNMPAVGPGSRDGLILATGHFRNGILLAPLAAAAVVETLRDLPSSPLFPESGKKGELAGRAGR
jgi:glycine oxidase